MSCFEVSPNASALVLSMRSIGYSFNNAIADIVDNSIAANATQINIQCDWAGYEPTLEIKDKDGRIFRADPNKSLYIFAPSAFPIENKKSYCRDFCVFFPSYNRGFSNNFSLQLGAFVVPGMSFDDVPIV